MSLEGEQAPNFELQSTGGGTVSLSEKLADGPVVVLINRGHWCSFCAEQIGTFDAVAYDLWFNDNVDVLPVVVDPLQEVAEMRDYHDYDFHLLADPEGEVAEQYSGTEQTSHGLTGVAATYVIEEDGVVRYEDVSERVDDRTYGNWTRYFVRNDYEDPFEG